MQDLRVIGVQSGALLVSTDAGGEYRLPVTHTLHSQLRAASPGDAPVERKAPPREIQALVRSGKTPQQVADLTGADLDYVHRFEGPVLAERAFVLESARAVTVSVADDAASGVQATTFGAVIDERLDGAETSQREWSAYKDAEHGWVVHLAFVTHEVERDATWRFDPKKSVLAPLGGDAHRLSQHSEEAGPLVPRLRAVSREPRHDDTSGRFDSGAFLVDQVDEVELPAETATDRLRPGVRGTASFAAVNRAPDDASGHDQTADLLEALRRRRGEREAARFSDDDGRSDHPVTGTIRVIDVPLDDFDLPEGATKPTPVLPDRTTRGDTSVDDAPVQPTGIRGSRGRAGRREMPSAAQPTKKARGRTSMPSWDEIVFGARSDDDPA
jgi:hypothetical protein